MRFGVRHKISQEIHCFCIFVVCGLSRKEMVRTIQHACKVFGVTSRHGLTPKQLKAKFLALSKVNHPDSGGSNEKMHELTAAYKLLKETTSNRRPHSQGPIPSPRRRDGVGEVSMEEHEALYNVQKSKHGTSDIKEVAYPWLKKKEPEPTALQQAMIAVLDVRKRVSLTFSRSFTYIISGK
jgi:hypothetical protein